MLFFSSQTPWGMPKKNGRPHHSSTSLDFPSRGAKARGKSAGALDNPLFHFSESFRDSNSTFRKKNWEPSSDSIELGQSRSLTASARGMASNVSMLR